MPKRLEVDPGFTLVELMLVIAIIGILSAMVLTCVRLAQKQAKKAQARTQLENLKTAITQYQSDNGKFPLDQWDVLGQEPGGHSPKAGAAGEALPPSAWMPGASDEPPSCYTLIEALDGDRNHDNGTAYMEFDAADFPGDTGARILHAPDPGASERPWAESKGVVLLDPWGNPWRYRQNERQAYRAGGGFLRGEAGNDAGNDPWQTIMNPSTFDLWSMGPDELDWNAPGASDAGEDNIANWN